MLKKFIPPMPLSSIGEGSLSAGTDENNGLGQREEPRTSPPTIDPKKYMAEHSGKDILSSDVEIKGSIKFQKELLIDGKVEGEINSDGVLTIGENADIQGEIKTKSITVYGKVRGNITVGERCELKSRCTLQGELKAARISRPLCQSRWCGSTPKRSRSRRFHPIHPSSESWRVSGTSTTAPSSSVSIAKRNRRSVRPPPRRFVRSAARTLICAITKSPRVSAAPFARTAKFISQRRAILRARAFAAAPL